MKKGTKPSVNERVGEAISRPPPDGLDSQKGRGFQRAVLSVARITMRMRTAVSSMRTRTTHRRTRTRITARGLQTGKVKKYIKSSLRHTDTSYRIAEDEKSEPQ